MKLLFISRAFPPVVGGIEKQNFELASSLGKLVDLDLVANRRGKKFLPLFLPYAAFCGLWKARKADYVLLGDAVLSPVGLFLSILLNKRVYCIVHGLDITFRNPLYQRVFVRFCLPRLSGLIAVGNATKTLTIAKGIHKEKVVFIPNGIRPTDDGHARVSDDFRRQLPERYFLFLGRLVPRKGVVWFLQTVAPKLPDSYHYVVAGDGPHRLTISAMCETHKNIVYLGEVSDNEKQYLYRNSIAFLQPNIPVENDIEGFGLVVLEAVAAGTIVYASNLEGLKDAVKNEKNGYLVEPKSGIQWVEALTNLHWEKERSILIKEFKEYTLNHYHWDSVAKKYLIYLTNH